MTKLFYGYDVIDAIDGKTENVDFVTLSLDDREPLPEEILRTQRLLILGAIGSILASEKLEELYVPIQLDEQRNILLEDLWEDIKSGRDVVIVKFNDDAYNEGYVKLSNELAKYRRAGLMIIKTETGALAEVVEIEKL